MPMLAYFDCFSGISGDMTLGALIDLGVPAVWLKDKLSQLPLTDFELSETSVSRHGIHAKYVTVEATDHQHSRHYSDIVSLIGESPLSQTVKERSRQIFDKIADAEAGIHGCSKETVHFHEVGGLDAIVDIVGTALCMEYLKIDTVISSRIPLGSGFVSCSHGTLPVPAPATVAILKGIPVYGADIPYELVTPTGAAIIATLADGFETIPDMIVENIGYGAGTREIEARPNLLRIITGKAPGRAGKRQKDRLVVIETCIDDMNPEVYGYLMDRLFEDGALDVYLIPVFMKKNRPGTMVQALCPIHRKEALVRRILSETTSLGVRFYEVHRDILPRKVSRVETSYGRVEIKQVRDPNGDLRFVPEYEVCKKIALERNLPLRVVYETILREAES